MLYTREAPLAGKWDVIVCGAGPSGIAAAVCAARQGMRVMLLERYGAAGGCLTLGNVTTVMGGVAKGTLKEELCQLLKGSDGSTGIDPEYAKGALIDLLVREHVEFRLQSPVVDVWMEENAVRGVFVMRPEGIVCMQAGCVIDATGDGYVAAMAGAPVMVGRDGDGLVQPSSLMYIIEGVDPESTLVCQHEEDYTVLPDGREYLAVCAQAAREGKLPSNITIVRLYSTGRAGERLVNATQANGICVLSEGDTERAEALLRRQIEQVNRFLRDEIPGFGQIHTRISASTLGVRESRRIAGKYLLDAEDLIAGRRFEDVVVHRASFSIDIHNPTGGGQAETDGCPHRTQPYDIPMRCLQPQGVENLILCGRCISGSHRAHASYRVINIVMAIGQAAGTMAAVSLRSGVPVSRLDFRPVQRSLEAQGCVLFD